MNDQENNTSPDENDIPGSHDPAEYAREQDANRFNTQGFFNEPGRTSKDIWRMPDLDGTGNEDQLPSGPENDARIRRQIQDRMAQRGIDDQTAIDIEVNDGNVVLTGTVPDAEMRSRIEDTLKTVLGIQSVDNQIKA